jgi:hypothetical protein
MYEVLRQNFENLLFIVKKIPLRRVILHCSVFYSFTVLGPSFILKSCHLYNLSFTVFHLHESQPSSLLDYSASYEQLYVFKDLGPML